MVKQAHRVAVVAVACLMGSSFTSAQPKPTRPEVVSPAPPVDLAALAERLVGTTGNVKEGEIVELLGGPGDLPLLEEVAVAVRKRGAYPILTVESESLARKLIASVPAKYDGQAPKAALGLAKLVNVRIIVPAVRDPTIEEALPPERRAAMAKAFVPVVDLQLRRNVRLVELGNGLLPSASRARLLGVSEAELTKMFWDGVSADYATVEEKAKALQKALAAGVEVRVTAPNGTDLRMKVKGRKALASDGVISDADIKAGGASVNAWLPAGEVYVTPVPGTAEGKIVDDRMLFDGKEVTGVTVEVKKGKIVSINAAAGWDAVKGRFDAAGPGKNEISLIDIGINPAVKTRGKLETWMGAGMVSIGAGGNTWAGGTNKEPFLLVFQLPAASVTLDGVALVDAGTLR